METPRNEPPDEQHDGQHDELGAFGEVLAHWRKRRGMSKKALAEAMDYDPSYISHIEAGRYPAGEDFARRAEAKLSAGGQVWQSWQETATTAPSAASAAAAPSNAPGGLVVEDDHAELRYAGGIYTATMRRRLRNAGPDPVTRYLARISVDRYPGEPARSNAHYRAHPLTWDELGLVADCDGEPMDVDPKHDRDSFKEVWLCFANERGKFPLYPGERATITYAYTVPDTKWGPWFQRAIRLPTRHLGVTLTFPADLEPKVWGTETSTTAEAVPLHNPITRTQRGEETLFAWGTADPPMGARYRLEWRFRARPGEPTGDASPSLRTSSDRMKAAGIVQAGDAILAAVAEPFDLPEQAEAAGEVIDALFAALQRVREQHVFGKGMGLAAPQIGIGRAAAIVIPPDPDADPVVLLNPRITDASTETDEQYEGCLSFFDVRGMVPRPLTLEVEHTSLDGQTKITTFPYGVARLVAHEVDHLAGRLYTSRMREGVTPIPVEEYRGIGQPWKRS
ncbi:peptide deformylase [Nonomuraea candida]|uniref:peptide deformylase n=1 Tax=Nonomuraea candida TaxID=359159 RepID=UPI001FE0342B|nr:peptide deformylase [Nonomuraea candida]